MHFWARRRQDARALLAEYGGSLKSRDQKMDGSYGNLPIYQDDLSQFPRCLKLHHDVVVLYWYLLDIMKVSHINLSKEKGASAASGDVLKLVLSANLPDLERGGWAL